MDPYYGGVKRCPCGGHVFWEDRYGSGREDHRLECSGCGKKTRLHRWAPDAVKDWNQRVRESQPKPEEK